MRFRCEAEWNDLAALSLPWFNHVGSNSSRSALIIAGDRLFSGKAIEIA